jgi:hypothetical protein
MKMLDLFSGRWGWSKAFAARGWECLGADLMEPPEIPPNCKFMKADVMRHSWLADGLHYFFPDVVGSVCLGHFDFICASSPCEQFSLHGMKHFHPNPPYPAQGIALFEHTRALCEASGVPYVMENVRSAQAFVGQAKHHCGPFYLWGSGVPPLLSQGIQKGDGDDYWTRRKKVDNRAAHAATIPPELASTVADYAGRILELEVRRA